MYRGLYCPRFCASTGGLETYPPMDEGQLLLKEIEFSRAHFFVTNYLS